MAEKHPPRRRPAVLTNPNADRIRNVAALAGRRVRRRTGLVLIEGPQAVREALKFCGSDLVDVFLSEDVFERDPQLVELAREATHWVHPVTAEVARAISPDSQGVAAVVKDFRTLELPRIDWNFVVIAPQIQDPGNLGTLIRIADAAGADALLLCAGTADPTSPKVVRASAGSVFHLPTVVGMSAEDAYQWARARGMRIVGADGNGAIDLFAAADGLEPLDLAAPIAWVFGNEAHGFNQLGTEGIDDLVSIPLSGHAESLNVAAAAAVALMLTSKARRSSGEAGR
ncbi:MAG: RNA methyltransferase [Actinomycetaceae bacterium]|nr:RNA methyltransferase [Actinomycetaceae bacterium]